MVAVKSGNIITFSSGPRHGEKAIPMLQEMTSAVVRVSDEALSYRSNQMPPTQRLLEMLEADLGPQTAGEAAAGGWRSGGPGAEAEQVRLVLGQLLIDFMGPVAPMVCDQHLSSLGGSLDTDRLRVLIAKLAAEIGDSEEAQTFTEQARNALHV